MLSDARVTKVRTTLADRVVFFLTNPFISSLLLSLGLLGIFIEIRSPGFGVPGFLGLLCVGLFFGGHMLSENRRGMGVTALPHRCWVNSLGDFCDSGFRCRWYLRYYNDVRECLLCFRPGPRVQYSCAMALNLGDFDFCLGDFRRVFLT